MRVQVPELVRTGRKQLPGHHAADLEPGREKSVPLLDLNHSLDNRLNDVIR
nr:hypothetical protein [Arthrobacter polaris]